MSEIPFSVFSGYLKKLDLDRRSEIEQALFEQLFPQFFAKRTLDPAVRDQNRRVMAPLAPLIEIQEDLDQPRRFSGVSLPRQRYYSVCRDGEGDDDGTLVNELRAYRDPVATGRVDVVDLARDSKQTFGPPRPALAIVLYDVEKSSFADRLLRSRTGSRGESKRLLVVEYPYDVLAVRIAPTIDLRVPRVRQWFFECFSREQEDGSILWVVGDTLARKMPAVIRQQMEREATTILSRFQHKAGVAPIPRDFYGMLPTLMNPELGGGTTADGGATLQAIGTWMCRNQAAALIYPSARSDAFAHTPPGGISACGGWNLVDYREAVDPTKVQHFFLVQSPWAWTAFPSDVRLEIERTDSSSAGSFRVTGIEARARRDYDRCLQSLEAVDAEARAIGGNRLLGSGRDVTLAGAWRLGSSSVEWLTQNAVDKQPLEGRRQLLVFSGLATRARWPFAAGRMDEIERDVTLTGNVSGGISHSMDLVDWLARRWTSTGLRGEAAILLLSNRLHVLRFFVAGMLLARQAGISLGSGHRQQVSTLLGELNLASAPLSENLRRIIAATVDSGLSWCEEDSSRRGISARTVTEEWRRNWSVMVETAWAEMCADADLAMASMREQP